MWRVLVATIALLTLPLSNSDAGWDSEFPTCTVATVAACGAATGKQTFILVTDSDTTIIGAVPGGGGSNTVVIHCDGTTCTIISSEQTGGLTAHGEMTQNADPGACNSVTIGAQDVFVIVDGFSGGALLDITFDSDTLIIPVGDDGDYYIIGSVSFEGAAGSIFEFCASIDGAEQATCCTNRATANNDVGAATFNCILALVAGEALSMEVADHDATPQNPLICDGHLTIEEL